MKCKISLLFVVMMISLSVSGQDQFSERTSGDFDSRSKKFFSFCNQYGMLKDRWGVFRIVSQVGGGLPVEQEYIIAACQDIYRNRDCTDFTIHGLLRLKYFDKRKPFMTEEVRREVDKCLLDYKYWWDDGRRDTTYRCYHTENHQGLFHSAELLAGQLYKDRVFTNGQTGEQHYDHAQNLLDRWMKHKYRFGFSEWLSTYYEVDMMLLANLYDFAENPVIRQRAQILLDLLMFDMSLVNFHGVIRTTSGRIYASSLVTDLHSLSPALKLLWGTGIYLPGEPVMAAATLATSAYRCPEVINRVALDTDKDVYAKQRHSIEVSEAEQYGLKFGDELDCHLFWGMQEFIHPQAVKTSKMISDKYKVYPYGNYDQFIRRYEKQVEEHGKIVDPYLDRFALSEANLILYRRPEYILSSVQSYRPKALGYQQHPWMAAFDRTALVFTSYPGAVHLKGSPNYWAGAARLPRTVQYRNVVISLYDIPSHERFDFTHAYFPRSLFDEVVETDGWIFGRKADGYVALYSSAGYSWKADDKGVVNDVVAPGKQTVWVCEMGTKREHRSFERFMNKVIKGKVKSDGLNVQYRSTLYGDMYFGWSSDFIVKDKVQPLRFNNRYENPYCTAPFDAQSFTIRNGKESLFVDFDAAVRLVNGKGVK